MKIHKFSYITLIAGAGKVWADIIKTLLNDNACVFAPVNNLRQIDSLQKIKHTKGKLVTELVDIADYKRAETYIKEFVVKYGNINLVISSFEDLDSLADKYFSNIDFDEFEKVINNDVINFFIFFRIVLRSMKKDGHGMFIYINHYQNEIKKDEDILSSFINKMQMEISNIFLKKLQAYKVKYHYLTSNNLQIASKKAHKSMVELITDMYRQPDIVKV